MIRPYSGTYLSCSQRTTDYSPPNPTPPHLGVLGHNRCLTVITADNPEAVLRLAMHVCSVARRARWGSDIGIRAGGCSTYVSRSMRVACIWCKTTRSCLVHIASAVCRPSGPVLRTPVCLCVCVVGFVALTRIYYYIFKKKTCFHHN